MQYRRKSSYKHDVANYTENNSDVVCWPALIINNGNEDKTSWKEWKVAVGVLWSGLNLVSTLTLFPNHFTQNGYNFLMSLKGK